MKVQKNGRQWRNAEIWPNAYVQTPAIDCSKHKSVVLKFQQNFFWNRRDAKRGGSGLFVGVSNNGTDWTEYEVRNGIGSGQDCPNPMDVELNANIKGTQVIIHPAVGDFEGRLHERLYLLEIHTNKLPKRVKVNGKKLRITEVTQGFSGPAWWFVKEDRGGILYIATTNCQGMK